MIAASSKRPQFIKLIIESGADPNQRDIHGLTALMYAAMNGDRRCYDALVSLGADAGAKDLNAMTAKDYALENGHVWPLAKIPFFYDSIPGGCLC